MLAVLTVVVVMAVGGYWEIFEFGVGQLADSGHSPLTQYGLADTLGDLTFNSLEGVVVAVVVWVRSAG